MTTSDDQVRLREHLAQLRQAAHGIGKDVEIELSDIERKIERLPSTTAKEAKYFVLDIEDDLAAASHRINVELRKLPGEVGHGMAVAGGEIKSGAIWVGAATRDSLETAAKKTKEGTKNVLASAAGVRRTPMKEWKRPPEGDESADRS